MKLCAKIGIFLLVGANFCWTMGLSSDGEWHSDKITLGEISLENYNDNRSDNQWNGQKFYGQTSLTPLDYTVEIPNEHRDKFIPIVNEIGVPIVEEIPIEIPQIEAQTVWQPYPVLVPVRKPVPYEVVKYIVKRIEKKVPTPVEKIVPVPLIKPVPIQVERYQAVPFIKKVPIKIPVIKTVVHRSRNILRKFRYSQNDKSKKIN